MTSPFPVMAIEARDNVEERTALRIVTAAAGYGIFVTGAIIFALYALLLRVLPYLAARLEMRRKLLQAMLKRLLSLYRSILNWLGVVHVAVRGTENTFGCAGQSLLIVANHPTLIDALILLEIFPHARCVAKGSLNRFWLFRFLLRELGYVQNDACHNVVEECCELLRDRIPLILFPEGTRSGGRLLRTFERGAAVIALRSGCKVLPAIIRCSHPLLSKGLPWYRLPAVSVDLTVELCYPLGSPERPSHAGEERVITLEYTDRLQTFFQSRQS